jgi:chorismate mutase
MINQGIPLQGVAYVSISIETLNLECSAEDLINRIKKLDGTKKVELLAQN